MPPEDGFSFDEGGLRRLSASVRSAGEQLANHAASDATTAAAGDSTELVADTVEFIRKTGQTMTKSLDQAAEAVDAARGSYADIENTNEGALRYSERGAPPDADPGPLHDADERPNELPPARRPRR